MKKEAYRRLNLKNGWDLPKGEKPPLTGRKQELVRAYELLVQKTDEDYLREAEMPAGAEGALAGVPQAEPEKEVSGTEAPAEAAEKPPAEEAEKPPELSQEEAWEAELRDSSDEGWMRRRRKKLLIAGIIVIAAVLSVGGRLLFGPPVLTANISTYQDVAITIEGLTDEPFEITPKELSKMKLASLSVDVHEEELAPDETPELGKAIGPTLETFLAEYGLTIDDIRSMKVYAENERSTAYVHTLTDNEIILSVANGRRPLGEKEAPLRIAVSDTDAGEWSGWIRRIVFTRMESSDDMLPDDETGAFDEELTGDDSFADETTLDDADVYVDEDGVTVVDAGFDDEDSGGVIGDDPEFMDEDVIDGAEVDTTTDTDGTVYDADGIPLEE